MRKPLPVHLIVTDHLRRSAGSKRQRIGPSFPMLCPWHRRTVITQCSYGYLPKWLPSPFHRIFQNETGVPIKSLCMRTDRSKQTGQTQIRLLLFRLLQSDLGLHCLLLHLYLLGTLLHCKTVSFVRQLWYYHKCPYF